MRGSIHSPNMRATLLAAVLSLSACATANSRTYDTLTVTRAAEVLHLLVVTGEHCEDSREATPEQPVKCADTNPAANVEVVLQGGDGQRTTLGSTSPDGRLEVPLTRFDALFQGQSIAADARAQLLVHDKVAAELPLGEIVNRQSVVDSAIAECDRLLEDAAPDRDYAQQLIARLLDLQMRGIADLRIADRASKLYEHLKATESIWSAPARWFNEAKELLARLRGSGDEQAVPQHVKENIEQTGSKVESQSFQWALGMLPAMCKITVRGGAVVAGQMIATGAPGVALAIIAASVGDDLSNWLINSCCQMASKSISRQDGQTTSCGPVKRP